MPVKGSPGKSKRPTQPSKLQLPDQSLLAKPSAHDQQHKASAFGEEKGILELTVPAPGSLPAQQHFNPLEQKLSFSACIPTDKELAFPKYLHYHGLDKMIMHALVRLERQGPLPEDPWEWLRSRIFMGSYNPGDYEKICQDLAELKDKRARLLSENATLSNKSSRLKSGSVG